MFDLDTIRSRHAAVRAVMRSQKIDALVVPRADEYLGEYIPERNERLRWISGFCGSAGMVFLLNDRAALFVDGRYTEQARQQTAAELFEYHHLIDEPHLAWLARTLGPGKRVGYDPRLHTLTWQKRALEVLGGGDIQLVALDRNPIDACWSDRPPAACRKALLLAEIHTGKHSRDKRRNISAAVVERGAEAALIFATDSVAWLLNIRGSDVPHTPLLLGFALIDAVGQVTLFTDPAKIPEGFAAHVGEGVTVCPEDAAPEAFRQLKGKRVLADPDTANAWCQLSLAAAGAELVAAQDPVIMPKACKNEVEVSGMRAAHRRDGAAVCRFLAWLDGEVAAGRLHDEAVLADKLYEYRSADPLFQDTSFDTISASGANAALAHYRHSDTHPGRPAMDSIYLVDSGGQYLDGTTDITRTVAIGEPDAERRRMFTLVLKGHIALDLARFPKGTTGTQLDVLARQFLWQAGFDYDHGTGHGVGCFLSVHEGPQRIGKAWNAADLRPGMIISNEPGYYKSGAYGIRCENLVLVTESHGSGETPMYGFEAITLAPFDARLLDIGLMTQGELQWLNAYHARVEAEIGPLLDSQTRDWLKAATRPLEA
ncbi:MAG: aminopeptidase P family protein [Steroidobacteraceae bacterium]